MIELVTIFGPRVVGLWSHGYEFHVWFSHWLYLMHIGGEEARYETREMKESVGGKNSLAEWELTRGLGRHYFQQLAE